MFKITEIIFATFLLTAILVSLPAKADDGCYEVLINLSSNKASLSAVGTENARKAFLCLEKEVISNHEELQFCALNSDIDCIQRATKDSEIIVSIMQKLRRVAEKEPEEALAISYLNGAI